MHKCENNICFSGENVLSEVFGLDCWGKKLKPYICVISHIISVKHSIFIYQFPNTLLNSNVL